MRIAMWSGPRNLSTAMMYCFGNRPDFAIWDEPFYAPYLATTGLDHPMRTEILSEHEVDPKVVARRCLGHIPEDKPHFYMKHMPHHLLPDFPMEWANCCVNIHLIRHPARVVASYGVKRKEVTSDDIGFGRQTEIYRRLGGVVIDSADVRHDPEAMLRLLCEKIELPFDPAMLSWPAGPRSVDGVWAKHWYGSVHQSTGFAGAEAPLPALSGALAELAQTAMPDYEELATFALKP